MIVPQMVYDLFTVFLKVFRLFMLTTYVQYVLSLCLAQYCR